MRFVDISFAFILSFYLSFFLFGDDDISATVTPISVKVCVTIDLPSGHIFSPFGGNIFTGHQK